VPVGVLEESVKSFPTDGFLLVPSILDPSVARNAVDQASELLAEIEALGEPQPDVQYESAIDPRTERHAIRRVSRILDRRPAFRAVATHRNVVQWMRALLGDDECELCLNRHNMMIVKPARFGSENVWHADAGSWLNDRLVSFMYLLDPATRENGCLEVVPGSHRFGIPHQGEGLLDLTSDENARWVEKGIAVEMNPGDGLFFHSGLLHYSAANHSSQSRRNLIFAYAPSHAKDADEREDRLQTMALRVEQ